MAADHAPCVLTPQCGPHCGLDRGYLGHCDLCHADSPLGRHGMHESPVPWLRVVQHITGSRLYGQMPALSPPPGYPVRDSTRTQGDDHDDRPQPALPRQAPAERL